MTDYVPYQNGPLTTNALESGDTLYVGRGILVTSPSGTNDLAYARPGATNVHFMIDGTAAGIYGLGIGDPSDSIFISASGTVRGRDFGIISNGSGGFVENQGRILSESVGVFGIAGSVYNELHNSGLIQAGMAQAFGQNAAIWNQSGSTAGTELIVNTGTIKTLLRDSYSFLSQSVTAETIRNSGTMIGKIDLGAGSDVYDGRLGQVQGAVFGGNDGDKLYGGKEANELHGDAGKDRLYGGAGADKLYGGADSDTFIFQKASESTSSARDTIYDFNHIDIIDLHTIDAKTASAGDQAFKFIGSSGYGHQAGELRYAKSGGDTFIYGDTNGDGKSDFSIKLEGSFTMEKGDFLL